MKKNFLYIFIFFFYGISFSQWQPDLRLTYDTGSCFVSLNNARCVAINENIVHIVWCDERDGNREIYYKRSTNNGINWQQDVRLTNNTAVSWRPSIAVVGSLVHTVWCDNRNGNYEIYYKYSNNNGVDWSNDIRLTYDSNISWAPSLAVNGSMIHIVWEETRDGNEEIYYKRSTNGGMNWSEDIRLTNNPLSSLYPSIAVSGNFIHVTWYDFRTGNRAIFYKRSTDSGITWGQDIQITGNSVDSYNPAIAVSGQTVHITWHDRRDVNEEIFYIRSSNQGIDWSQEKRLTFTSGVSWYPSIAVSGINVHIAWYDNYEGNYKIYYCRSLNDGIDWEQNTRLTNNTSESLRPSIAVSGSIVHIIWNDYRDGDWEIYYKQNPTGNPIGIKKINSEISNKFSLFQNFPNPFNQSTLIKYICKERANVKIKIFDIFGKEIITLLDKEHQPGIYLLKWDSRKYASGIYYYSLFINDILNETKKMILIK